MGLQASNCPQAFTLTVESGETDSFFPQVHYDGDFPQGKWLLRYLGAFCEGDSSGARCVVAPYINPESRWLYALAITKLIYSDLAPFFDSLVLHASSVLADSGAQLFLGPSGAGKSTIARLIGSPLITDDFTPVSLQTGVAFVYSSPFSRTEKVQVPPMNARIKALNFLVQDKKWSRSPLGLVEGIQQALKNTNQFCRLKSCREASLDTAIRLCHWVDLYELKFSLSPPPSGMF